MLLVGTDPELFLEDETGKVISAIDKIGGSKEEPKKLHKLGKGFAIQEDNVLLEYNLPASKSIALWLKNHTKMTEYLTKLVGDMGLKLSTKASHSMDEDQLDHPKAWVFGCEPDFDVWALEWNKKPKCNDKNLRSAGGHIHIGYDNPTASESIKIARLCDLFIGAPLKMKDPDKLRASLYGRAGAIRFKPYGLEYRTPSNYWSLTEQNRSTVFRAVQDIIGNRLHSYEFYIDLAKDAQKYLAGESDVPEAVVETNQDLGLTYV
jgi:hypothetical protein